MRNMNNAKSTAKRLVQALDLPLESIAGFPRIEMMGNREIIIEGIKGLLGYEEGLIKINAGKVVMSIEGRGLNIKVLNSENIVIEGYFTSVQFSS